MEIGDHIQGCFFEFESEEEGRTNLWTFVSKFTEETPEKLQKLYKRAKKELAVSKQVCQINFYSVNRVYWHNLQISTILCMCPQHAWLYTFSITLRNL